jgi:hypothetical protein
MQPGKGQKGEIQAETFWTCLSISSWSQGFEEMAFHIVLWMNKGGSKYDTSGTDYQDSADRGHVAKELAYYGQ